MMRFDEADPWFTWQQRVERERLVDSSRDILPQLPPTPDPDPQLTLFGERPASTLRFPAECQRAD
jgi:hypothetical protein